MCSSFATTVSIPSKWPGRDAPLEHAPTGRRRPAICGAAVRVHLGDGRREEQVDAAAVERGDVGVEGARVAVEVLLRPELQRVHEDRDDDEAAELARAARRARGGRRAARPSSGTSATPAAPRAAGRPRSPRASARSTVAIVVIRAPDLGRAASPVRLARGRARSSAGPGDGPEHRGRVAPRRARAAGPPTTAIAGSRSAPRRRARPPTPAGPPPRRRPARSPSRPRAPGRSAAPAPAAVTAHAARRSRARSMLVPVNAMAGFSASGIAPAAAAGAQHLGADARRGVHDELPGEPAPASASPATSAAQLRIRHGEEHQLAALDEVRDVEARRAGQHGLGAVAARVRDRRDADDRVARSGERRAEHRSDPSGADDRRRRAGPPPSRLSLLRDVGATGARRPPTSPTPERREVREEGLGGDPVDEPEPGDAPRRSRRAARCGRRR